MEQIEQTEQPATQTSSLMDRITNVFTSPSELFDEVAVSQVQTSSWLVPLILSILTSKEKAKRLAAVRQGHDSHELLKDCSPTRLALKK